MIYTLKNENRDAVKIKTLIQKVEATGGIAYAVEKMNAYRDEALQLLYTFPDNEVRHSLEQLVRYTTGRKY